MPASGPPGQRRAAARCDGGAAARCFGRRRAAAQAALRGRPDYDQLTFRELEDDSNRIASGLRQLGVAPGTRLALLVRPGIDFVSLVFALFKAGAVAILIDPGMGRKTCSPASKQAEPEGFVAIPVVQAVRSVLGRRFPPPGST